MNTSIISKETVIQIELSKIHSHIIAEHKKIKSDLKKLRNHFAQTCNKHLENGFQLNSEIVDISLHHQSKYTEYDIYNHLIEIINDFKDLQGNFPEYQEMFKTLQQVMFHLAKHEKYELAATTKKWVDLIDKAIKNH